MKLWETSFKHTHVLCMGDLMLDRFVYGSVDRISPEAPVPVLKINRDFLTLGGAGNVVRNLSALECPATFIGIRGDDPAGQQVKSLMDGLPHVTAHLVAEGRTTVKSRFVSLSQQILRVDEEVISAPSQEVLDSLQSLVLQNLATAKAVIISDYGKGSLPHALCQFVIKAATAAGIPVIVDPKGQDYARYKGAAVLTPNEKELAEVSPCPLVSDTDMRDAMAHLKSQLNLEAVLVTRGPKGMVLSGSVLSASVLSASVLSASVLSASQGEPLYIPAQARDVFDVSGAGDTVIATFAAAVSTGWRFEDAARLANMAAGIVVGKTGTAVVSQPELAAAVFDHSPPMLSRIMSLEEAKSHMQLWRRQGLTIGFTNGCFDLLHLGHLHTLGSSKKMCDRLLVGLNSDASIRRLKGESRPVQQEMVRAHVLAALECVDGVILFEEDTPIRLIESLLPDILCKGADYAADEVIGGDIVRLNGGKVHLIDLKPGHSTTGTVAKMQKVA